MLKIQSNLRLKFSLSLHTTRTSKTMFTHAHIRCGRTFLSTFKCIGACVRAWVSLCARVFCLWLFLWLQCNTAQDRKCSTSYFCVLSLSHSVHFSDCLTFAFIRLQRNCTQLIKIFVSLCLFPHDSLKWQKNTHTNSLKGSWTWECV